MAEFHIKGHVNFVTSARFVAVVCVIPSGRDHANFSEMIQEASETRPAAVERMKAIAIALGERIRRHGDLVLSVDLAD